MRVYHAKGLLPEPERDASGYRRYDAQAIIDLTRIVTLAQAGVPLARIPDVLNADANAASEQIDRIDTELRSHIRRLLQRRHPHRTPRHRQPRLGMPRPTPHLTTDRVTESALAGKREPVSTVGVRR
ncbi:MerR family transcriptional regulator [Microbacterium sp. p3-SID337]|uniref:MerR family transcriptional regulator n=1 Tax=Microbacterium sp. p3-SID337 TaxID=2916213 RepID=UPI002882FE4B|nr:MerR family transcriptional regulator [Microbacterium sp. p3-SID337]